MMILLTIGALAVAGIAGTIRALANDGYRRLPRRAGSAAQHPTRPVRS